ncbi:hypothetical protein B0E44_15155 [Flavobacterium sp. A45]|nr:hypothetical protein B0E44_15155 [Flavobacterium sp. A45]
MKLFRLHGKRNFSKVRVLCLQKNNTVDCIGFQTKKGIFLYESAPNLDYKMNSPQLKKFILRPTPFLPKRINYR